MEGSSCLWSSSTYHSLLWNESLNGVPVKLLSPMPQGLSPLLYFLRLELAYFSETPVPGISCQEKASHR